jgi:uncharacterized membrane protein
MSPRTARIALAVLLLTIDSTLAVIRRVTNALRDAGMLKLTVGVIFALTAVAVVALFLRNPALRRPRTLDLRDVAFNASAGLMALTVFTLAARLARASSASP